MVGDLEFTSPFRLLPDANARFESQEAAESPLCGDGDHFTVTATVVEVVICGFKESVPVTVKT